MVVEGTPRVAGYSRRRRCHPILISRIAVLFHTAGIGNPVFAMICMFSVQKLFRRVCPE